MTLKYFTEQHVDSTLILNKVDEATNTNRYQDSTVIETEIEANPWIRGMISVLFYSFIYLTRSLFMCFVFLCDGICREVWWVETVILYLSIFYRPLY